MKRKLLFLVAFAISLASFGAFGSSQAFAATKTWTGGGSDTNMMTAGNWTGGAPVAGDDLVFPANITNRTVANNFTAGTSFNSITFSGTATGNSDYTLTGNSMTLVAGITNTMTGSFALYQTVNFPLVLNGSQTFTTTASGAVDFGGTLNLGSNTLTFNTTNFSSITGVISGSGAITKTGSGTLRLTGDNTYTGVSTVSAGALEADHANALGTTAGATIVASGASVWFAQSSGDVTYAEPLTLNGTGGASGAVLRIAPGFAGGGPAPQPPLPVSTFSGAITLQSNIEVSTISRDTKITGALTGSFTIGLTSGSTGSLLIASSSNGSATPNGTATQPVKTTNYPDNSPGTSIFVANNETAIVTGVYGDITVNPGGILKGTGTVGAAFISGIIAPGLSPGCLNTGNLTFYAGTYSAEIGGITACTLYDQIKVTGTVDVGVEDSTLSVSRYNSFKFVAGQKYVLISNDGTDAVTGTFKNLAEGATFTVDGYVLKISYKGGDGNDVELTVVSVPASPVTGFGLIKNNPLLSVVLITGAAGVIALMARNRKFAFRTTKR